MQCKAKSDEDFVHWIILWVDLNERLLIINRCLQTD